MREERKINKALQQDGVNTQAEILEELKRRYPQYVEQSEAKGAPNKKKRIAVISSVAAVAASVAIIVPCAVLLPNKGNKDQGNDIRYCSQGEYSEERCQYTLGDYSENHGGKILYFDWYDIAEDCFTFCYTSNADNEILCVEESMFLVDSNETIYLSVTKSNVYLSKFDELLNNCDSEKTVDKHTVKWYVNDYAAVCIFEDNSYRYFIRIPKGQDENRLFELTAELLGNN